MSPKDLSGLRSEVATILRLAGPLALAQGGIMVMGLVDTLIVGRAGALEMAGTSLGNSVASAVFVFGIGLALGIEPLVGQAFGAGEYARARGWMWQGLWLALIVSVPLMAVCFLATFAFEPFGIGAEIGDRATAYIFGRVFGVPFTLVSVGLRAYLANIGLVRPALVSIVVANIVNFFLDWALVLGSFGFPALGALGVGIATSLSMGVVCLLLGFAIYRARLEDGGHGFEKANTARMTNIFRLGWPIGAHVTVEVGIFTLVAALIGRFGEVPLASHQVAISMASVSFMMSVGIANATTARVGFYIGSGRPESARRSGLLGIGLGALFMGVSGLSFIVFRHEIVAQFTTEPQVRAVSAELLRIAGIFAVADGVQVVSAGALRGTGDTRWPFWANLVAHWALGLPAGLALVLIWDMGAAGYWWGLTLGLIGVAVTLSLRFSLLSRNTLRRLES